MAKKSYCDFFVFLSQAAQTQTRIVCHCAYPGCVLFVMKWCEHIINSQRKVTRSQRSVDRADSDVKWLDMQRAPSGPEGKTRQSGVTLTSPGVTHTHTHIADML